MLRLFQDNARAKLSSPIVSHRLQIQSWFSEIADLVAKPAKEWPDVSGIEVRAVDLKILLLVRHPDSPPELMLVVVYRNLNEPANEKISTLYDAKIFR